MTKLERRLWGAVFLVLALVMSAAVIGAAVLSSPGQRAVEAAGTAMPAQETFVYVPVVTSRVTSMVSGAVILTYYDTHAYRDEESCRRAVEKFASSARSSGFEPGCYPMPMAEGR